MNSVFVLALMAVSLETAPPSVQWAGSFGQVTVMRQGQPIDIQSGQTLSGEVSIETGGVSGAVLFQQPGACIQVGEAVEMAVDTTGESLRLFVTQGEVRAAVGVRGELELGTSLALTKVAGSVVRTLVRADRVLFLVEQGRAEIRLTDAGMVANVPQGVRRVAYKREQPNSIVLTSGQQVEIRPAAGFGNVTDRDDTEWVIDPDVWLVSISQNRSAANARNQQPSQPQRQPSIQDDANGNSSDGQSFNARTSSVSGINLTLGPTLASTGFSGAAFSPSDANQDTSAGRLFDAEGLNLIPFRGLPEGSAFPGVIHMVTGEKAYIFGSVHLTDGDKFLGGGATPTSQYWSIAEGTLPHPSQIVTGLGTGTSINPTTLAIPQFNGRYLVQLDQYPLNDSLGGNSNGNPQLAVTGLVGQTPTGPSIQGGIANLDERAQINHQATFALGEFAVRRTGDNPQIAMRRSDQDRQIVKDPDGNDVLDKVTPNSDVTAFVKVPDNRFLPQNKDVFVPVTDPNALAERSALRNTPTYSNSNMLRKAAFTTLTAQQLSGFSHRTGQTRFVVDGKIVDISGYRP